MTRIGITGMGLGLGHGGPRLTGGCAPYSQIDGSVSAGATFTHPADGVIAWTQTTIPTAGSGYMFFRMQDASNLWQLQYTNAGQISLIEKVAAGNTIRSIVDDVLSDGYRIVIVVEGTTIKVYSGGVLRITYASAVNFPTATAGKFEVVGTGAAIADLKTWSLACRAQEGV